MRLIDLDEFFRQNCIDRIEGKSCEECKHHVLEVSCERLMEQPTAERVGKWKYETMRHIITGEMRTVRICSECGGGWFRYDMSDGVEDAEPNYCPNCGARMDVPDNDVGETEGEEG